VVVRNLYSALVSGYLYHKMGRECSTDPFGRAGSRQRGIFRGWLVSHDWQAHLGIIHRTTASPTALDLPRAVGETKNETRNLCQFLAQEDEITGMTVYMNWAWNYYCSDLLKLYPNGTTNDNSTVSRESNINNKSNKTLYLCFHDVVRRRNEAIQFLFPSTLN
jgi:hypothetical protein